MTCVRALLLLSVAAAVGIGTACTNSGLQGVPTPADSGVPTTNPTAGKTTGGTDCSLAGTWEVSKAWCGNFEIDNDWFAVYPTTTMEITDAGGGTCDVAFNWSNAGCEEDEEWVITEINDSDFSVEFGGISTCAPDACTFFGSDATCAVGDRSVDDPVAFGLEVLQATQIRVTGLLSDGYPQCTLDLTTEWARQ